MSFFVSNKNVYNALLRAIASLLIAIIMLLSDNALELVVRIVALFMIFEALLSVFQGYLKVEDKSNASFLTNSNIFLFYVGIILFIFPGFTAKFIINILGMILVFFSIIKFVIFFRYSASSHRGFLALLFSIISFVGGLFLVVNPFSVKVMGILAGATLLSYSVIELISIWRQIKYKNAGFDNCDTGDNWRGSESKKNEVQDNDCKIKYEKDMEEPDYSGISIAEEVDYEKIEED